MSNLATLPTMLPISVRSLRLYMKSGRLENLIHVMKTLGKGCAGLKVKDHG